MTCMCAHVCAHALQIHNNDIYAHAMSEVEVRSDGSPVLTDNRIHDSQAKPNPESRTPNPELRTPNPETLRF